MKGRLARESARHISGFRMIRWPVTLLQCLMCMHTARPASDAWPGAHVGLEAVPFLQRLLTKFEDRGEGAGHDGLLDGLDLRFRSHPYDAPCILRVTGRHACTIQAKVMWCCLPGKLPLYAAKLLGLLVRRALACVSHDGALLAWHAMACHGRQLGPVAPSCTVSAYNKTHTHFEHG